MASADRFYSVSAISCDHCKSTIESGLTNLPGVTSVSVDVEARSVSVSGTADDSEIRSTLDDLGYSAEA
ncbi:heavy-metal-associated domain-containing protein [Kineosporia babensis]|uniref:Heavy-metal-associated domain-containing protein n=1 Tax=Kineosporia babensis TaxID=499548 RepID=A0A9X1NMB2_9ACTN|nr:heavy metal-associated domain-containing protein [Kineosporia babensis]MCD5316189.1 heavy-metal-associated domain-containing protein [Kineosporia babensis]